MDKRGISIELGIARELRKLRATGHSTIKRKMGPLDGPMAHPARLTASRDNLVARLPAKFRYMVEQSNKRLKDRNILKHEHARPSGKTKAKRKERSRKRIKRAPTAQTMLMEDIRRFEEFSRLRNLSKTFEGNQEILNRIQDRIKQLGYDPKNKTRRELLHDWKWFVRNRQLKVGGKGKSKGPSDGNYIPRRVDKTRADAQRTRDERKLNRMSGREPRAMKKKEREHFERNRQELLKRLGWA